MSVLRENRKILSAAGGSAFGPPVLRHFAKSLERHLTAVAVTKNKNLTSILMFMPESVNIELASLNFVKIYLKNIAIPVVNIHIKPPRNIFLDTALSRGL